MINVRRSNERGHANHGWLDSHHTFSFAGYHDPRFMGFRALRVINEDRVDPGAGFPTHGHRDMEIITYVLEGALEHEDSMGHGEVLRAGEVQRMTAGRGVTHSEFNHSSSDPVHFLQIWILPEKAGLSPSYEQKNFPVETRQGKLQALVSPTRKDGSLEVHQDVSLYASVLAPGQKVEHLLASGRHAWIQVARGSIKLNGNTLEQGDGAAVSNETKIELEGVEPSEVLLFDLA
jgi:redox-sensitive bicupin YhaK (pirin superfamily)